MQMMKKINNCPDTADGRKKLKNHEGNLKMTSPVYIQNTTRNRPRS